MMETLSLGPTIVLMTGVHTNFATFLMTHPELKKNVEHIYIMAGGVRSHNPTGCCSKNARSSCTPGQCGDRGNLFTDYDINPFAEFNVFGDPFAAYQVLDCTLKFLSELAKYFHGNAMQIYFLNSELSLLQTAS
eukprot:Gb_10917 [translate_table: standard]